MKKFFILLAMVAVTLPALAAGKKAGPTDAEADAMIQKLEQSGKLDAALDRAIQRYATRQQEAQRKQQEDQMARLKQMNRNVRRPDPARDHIYGEKTAEVTLIEFSDYECPFCKQFNGTPQEVVRRLGGRVNYVWRHFPLSFHNPMANREAVASECAAKLGGNDAFWTFTDAVMSRTASNGKGIASTGGDPLEALAAELKLDTAAFRKCMDSSEAKARVDDDQNDGARSGIQGTPGTIILNNRTGKTEFINGALPVDQLEAATRSVLN